MSEENEVEEVETVAEETQATGGEVEGLDPAEVEDGPDPEVSDVTLDEAEEEADRRAAIARNYSENAGKKTDRKRGALVETPDEVSEDEKTDPE